jgi:hypothetical protein
MFDGWCGPTWATRLDEREGATDLAAGGSAEPAPAASAPVADPEGAGRLADGAAALAAAAAAGAAALLVAGSGARDARTRVDRRAASRTHDPAAACGEGRGERCGSRAHVDLRAAHVHQASDMGHGLTWVCLRLMCTKRAGRLQQA